MSKRSAHHATLVIERPYAASPPRVFAAWALSISGLPERLSGVRSHPTRHKELK
jgi:hypothetical protein